MITQVVFNIDSKIKAKAMKRAKEKGIPLASILRLTIKAYAEGRLELDVLDGVHFDHHDRIYKKYS